MESWSMCYSLPLHWHIASGAPKPRILVELWCPVFNTTQSKYRSACQVSDWVTRGGTGGVLTALRDYTFHSSENLL